MAVELIAVLAATAVAFASAIPASRAWTQNQEKYLKEYAPEGAFQEPTFGYSSPHDPDQPSGRSWLIVARDNGLIELDYAEAESNPFNSSHQTISLRVQDFVLSTPLSHVLFMVPGRNERGGFNQTDDPARDGLLVFVANHRLVLLDPLTRTVYVNRDIGFQPRWLVQDVVSAGEMYDEPRTITEGIPPRISFHTYRYIVAANETRLDVYRVNYRSNFDIPVIPATDGFTNLVSIDLSVSSVPLAYYLQLHPERSGIFVPLSNNSIAVFSIDGLSRTYLIPTLAGEHASISAPLGFCRAPEVSMVYLPLKSDSSAGVLYLTPLDIPSGDITLTAVLEIDDPSATVGSMPDPANGRTPYFLVTHSGGGAEVVRGNANGTLDSTLNLHLDQTVRSFFYSPASNQVFALDSSGTIWASWTLSGGGHQPGWVDFSGDTDAQRTSLSYMAGWKGAKYSTALSSYVVYGFAFSPATGTAIVFALFTMPEGGGGGNGSGSTNLDVALIVGLMIVAIVATVLAVIVVLIRKPKEPLWQTWPPR